MRTDPTPYHASTPARIVAPGETVPPKLPRKTRVQRHAATNFYDAAHWDELAGVYLRQYELPSWSAPCEPEAMRRWLDRLDMTVTEYTQQTNTSLADFCTLNPAWPLRAWIGTVLELAGGSR